MENGVLKETEWCFQHRRRMLQDHNFALFKVTICPKIATLHWRRTKCYAEKPSLLLLSLQRVLCL